jgi:hypothetical protein
MHFTYDEIWRDMRALWAAHRDHLLPILGVFIFLPTLAINLFLAPAKPITPDWNGVQAAMDYVRANLVPLMGVRLVTLVGGGAMLSLLLWKDEQTVGKAIRFALIMLPGMFLLNLLVRLVTGAGLMLFIVPALYIAARTLLAPAAMMGEHLYNPLQAFGRGFDLSSGNGWRIVGFAAILLIVTSIAVQAVSLLIGVMGTLLLYEGGMKILAALLGALGEAVFQSLFALLPAALYLKLSGAKNGI